MAPARMALLCETRSDMLRFWGPFPVLGLDGGPSFRFLSIRLERQDRARLMENKRAYLLCLQIVDEAGSPQAEDHEKS
jgi:hypothetical protein